MRKNDNKKSWNKNEYFRKDNNIRKIEMIE